MSDYLLQSSGNEVEDDLAAVYGVQGDAAVTFVTSSKTDFKPWHHPVKQIVRDKQWVALTARLIADGRPVKPLRYFTLPGVDLLDVRLLAQTFAPCGIKVEYFGFDVSQATEAGASSTTEVDNAAWVGAESALRQSNYITDSALILPDKLEDIAVQGSQAANQLQQQDTFDIINLDACNHLAYRPQGREASAFDALGALLRHQMTARHPWLLFVTTRAEPGLLGSPGIAFQKAIVDNLSMPDGSGFQHALATAIDAEHSVLAAALSSTWTGNDASFLKLYTIGLGKYLLQHFHAQPNFPTLVELASAYAYRVHGAAPDMLALAFRIKPERPRTFAPNVGGAAIVPPLEPERAKRIAERAQRLQDIDNAISTEDDLKYTAVEGTKALLRASNYDLEEWRKWLGQHPTRPMVIESASLTP